MVTHYQGFGIFRLSHAEEALPEPESGELEELEARANRLGYELKPRGRFKLHSHVSTILRYDHTELSGILELIAGDGNYQDSVDLKLYAWLPELSVIETLEAKLPAFLRQLEAEGKTKATVSLVFQDKAWLVPSISLKWVDGELIRTEYTRLPFEH